MTDATKPRPGDGRRETAGVIAAPPLLFGAALIVAFGLHALHPSHLVSSATSALRLAGIASIVVGLLLSITVVRVFGRARTQVSPYRETTSFVCTGPYRYTRNPDYIGQTLLYSGIALLANSWWPLILLPLVLVMIHRGVVRREERYLEAKFGQEYRDYLTRVPRWL
jgi:protein-S-isoprenylcysteine O-methyltransferase Ste14